MGKFQDTTVKKIIGQLNDSFFLPDIQREYVWLNKEQDRKIELLFEILKASCVVSMSMSKYYI